MRVRATERKRVVKQSEITVTLSATPTEVETIFWSLRYMARRSTGPYSVEARKLLRTLTK